VKIGKIEVMKIGMIQRTFELNQRFSKRISIRFKTTQAKVWIKPVKPI